MPISYCRARSRAFTAADRARIARERLAAAAAIWAETTEDRACSRCGSVVRVFRFAPADLVCGASCPSQGRLL